MTGPLYYHLVFIGECRSLTAKRQGWSWKDGRLAAKPLFEALNALGIDPAKCQFFNLFTDPPSVPTVSSRRVAKARSCVHHGYQLVALGQRVSRELTKRKIDHIAIVHPAARGKIRKRERYIAHVRERIGDRA